MSTPVVSHLSLTYPVETTGTSLRHEIFIDIGSSTVKVYRYTNDGLEPMKNQTIFFKEGFDPNIRIAPEKQSSLVSLIQEVQRDSPDARIKLFATALFRTLSFSAKNQLVNDIYQKTGTILNIISQELESFYLEKALVGHCTLSEPVMLMNIGGGSTEIVLLQNQSVLDRQNIDIGVGTIVTRFPSLNDSHAGVSLQEITSYVHTLLKPVDVPVHTGFYSGGELTYMRCTDYALLPNILFADSQHPVFITIEGFSKRNADIFHVLSLDELEQRMPDNPKWMHGARACSAIAQAICEMYDITHIVPSDVNIMHGAAQQEFRTATICGSFRKYSTEMHALKMLLEEQGICIMSPQSMEVENTDADFVMCTDTLALSPLAVIESHSSAICDSDAVVVCNPHGYVGASTMYEIGYAHALGKRIICLEEPSEYLLRTLPIQIGL